MARARILEKKFANEDELKKIDGEVRDLINQAAEFATHDPEPDASELCTDVYREYRKLPRNVAPMPIEVLMPALSPTMEKGNLAKWLKKEGDSVKSGDVIAEIETDKATMEVEAADEGTLGKILVPEGTADVAVNTPIAVILGDGEDKSAIKDGKPAPQAEGRRAAPPAKAEEARSQSRAPKSAPKRAASARNAKSPPIPTSPKAPRWSP